MDIAGKTIVVLGGWGLVGSSVCRHLLAESPERLVITSLRESEARDAVEELQRAYPDNGTTFVPWWGNVFGRYDEREKSRDELLADPAVRRRLIDDIVDDLSEELLEASALYRLLAEHKPHAVIDCINTATAIAYQDVYSSARSVLKAFDRGQDERQTVERLLASLYIPQLIRHVQILNRGLRDAGSQMYVKIGTAGSGGMGLNIPYTHSEERPSRVLLSKTSVAGAHTLLLFLAGRTPGGPVIKEIKPTATIAWKRIENGEVLRRGNPIPLVDPGPDGTRLGDRFTLNQPGAATPTGKTLTAPFIDTGENGIFSLGEFEAITSMGQMEMITPEEIAEAVVLELRGGNSGHDVVNALDGSVYGPTYRGGYLRSRAVERLKKLEKDSGTQSIAFEMLGPPRLTKLLFEAHILGLVCGSMKNLVDAVPPKVASAAETIITTNADLRSRIVSIGIPILMPDGTTLLRGDSVKIPPFRGEAELDATPEAIESWTSQGWVDLREQNIKAWQQRVERIIAETDLIDDDDTSSAYDFTRDHWENFNAMPAGKLVAWIFTVEDEGARMKA